MISHKNKCICLHIPKAAGTSVERFLRQVDPEIPQKILRKRGFSHFLNDHLDYYVFSFVRNPYDRVVSAYKYFRQLKEGHRWYKRNSIISDAADQMSFQEFVNHIPDFMKLMKRQEGSFESGIHFQPFYYFIDQEVNYIGRFENIQDDYNAILSKLKLPLKPLRKTNATNNTDYRSLYIEETKGIVYNIYKEDIKKYNYKF